MSRSITFIGSKQRAAIGQLESAIFLWFNEPDPISILVLASNAHHCYHALGKNIEKPSWLQERLEKDASNALHKRLNYVQNFAKHGFMDLKQVFGFETILAEVLMLVSCDCHEQIFGLPLGPLMALYCYRVFSEHPKWTPKVSVDRSMISDAGQGSRKQCFDRLYPLFLAASKLP